VFEGSGRASVLSLLTTFNLNSIAGTWNKVAEHTDFSYCTLQYEKTARLNLTSHCITGGESLMWLQQWISISYNSDLWTRAVWYRGTNVSEASSGFTFKIS